MSTSNAKDHFLTCSCSHLVGWNGHGHLWPYLSWGTKSSQIWAFKLPALRWWMNAKSHNCNLLVGPRDATTMKICNAMINSCARHSRLRKWLRKLNKHQCSHGSWDILTFEALPSPPPLSPPHTKKVEIYRSTVLTNVFTFKITCLKSSIRICEKRSIQMLTWVVP